MTEGEGLEYADCLEQEWRARLKVLAEMREPFEGVSSEEIEREVAQAIAEVRREERLLAEGQFRRYGTEEHRGDEVEK